MFRSKSFFKFTYSLEQENRLMVLLNICTSKWRMSSIWSRGDKICSVIDVPATWLLTYKNSHCKSSINAWSLNGWSLSSFGLRTRILQRSFRTFISDLKYNYMNKVTWTRKKIFSAQMKLKPNGTDRLDRWYELPFRALITIGRGKD